MKDSKNIPLYTEAHIQLKNNPAHNPGLCLWDGEKWVGHVRCYFPAEVSHWTPAKEEQ